MSPRSAVWSTILLVLFGYSTGCSAGEPSVENEWLAPAPEAVKTFVAVLPDGWSCRQEQDSLVVRPHDNPAFVNLVGAAARLPGQSQEEYLDEHRVQFDYRIVLRFTISLTSEQVQEIVVRNKATRRALDSLTHGPLARPAKGVAFVDSPEGKAAAREYARLRQSIQPVPEGTLNETSVYLKTTDLGYARFRHEETKRECAAVRKLLIDQLVPYERATPKE